MSRPPTNNVDLANAGARWHNAHRPLKHIHGLKTIGKVVNSLTAKSVLAGEKLIFFW